MKFANEERYFSVFFLLTLVNFEAYPAPKQKKLSPMI